MGPITSLMPFSLFFFFFGCAHIDGCLSPFLHIAIFDAKTLE